MANLHAYKFKTVQTLITMLDKYSAEGYTTIEGVKHDLKLYASTEISKRMNKQGKPVVHVASDMDAETKARIAEQAKARMEACPSCKKGVLAPVHRDGNSVVWACKKCRWSTLREENSYVK